LFDIDVEIGGGGDDARGFGHGPAGIGVGDQRIGRVEDLAAGADAGNVFIGVTANFELEFAVALALVAGDVLGHLL
jgi:hypothetical protein